MPRHTTVPPTALLAVSMAVAGATIAGFQASPGVPAFYPLADLRPGMIAAGQTVFAEGKLEPFRAHIIGVLRNNIGPRHDLILAKLEGGPLAQTGVIQGMSGSPVYIDGKLLGAVSYALGSFPREPIAGITPIAEMIEAVDGGEGRTPPGDLRLTWPASERAVMDALSRVARTAAAPLATGLGSLDVLGPQNLRELAPYLRPIGSALVVSGLDPGLRAAVGGVDGPADTARAGQASAVRAPALRPGDAVGVSLIRGDLEMGATGTVTHIDGTRVYAFGHPFLNLGSAQLAMTQSHVFTVLPSLDTSMKIASLGPVIGVMAQDRTTAVGGRLGAGPAELHLTLRLTSSRGLNRAFTYHVVHDPQLTPLFAFVGIFNTLISYERTNGTLSATARGTVTFGDKGQVTLDDAFTGDGVAASAAGALTQAIGLAATNEFASVMPTALDLEIAVGEREEATTIERAWLDTATPRAGATHTLTVQLRRFRGARETVSMPIVMPTRTGGPFELAILDGPSLTALEKSDLKPGRATSWNALVQQMREIRSGNRIYVRLLAADRGTVVGGEALPGLPTALRSAVEADATASQAPVPKSVLGSWERRMDRAVRGSRTLTFTLAPAAR